MLCGRKTLLQAILHPGKVKTALPVIGGAVWLYRIYFVFVYKMLVLPIEDAEVSYAFPATSNISEKQYSSTHRNPKNHPKSYAEHQNQLRLLAVSYKGH